MQGDRNYSRRILCGEKTHELNGVRGFHGIDQIAIVVQSNVATAESSAAASEELSGQAAALRELVSKFRIKAN